MGAIATLGRVQSVTLCRRPFVMGGAGAQVSGPGDDGRPANAEITVCSKAM